ncbi:MAG: transposase [Chloroflexi bacterium]|uniref:Transposase n=1 Tax=Candidatus Chlorohelix allophototropha TaxID=3003348 RepID=A0A8T7M5V4_9CHLR|nr:transposase [Chloroflexota bacterium]WJW69414.1 transposase [Chloroflexota bacterium L227-S17]
MEKQTKNKALQLKKKSKWINFGYDSTNKKAYTSNLTETAWQIILPHLPPLCPIRRKPKWARRDLIDGMLYLYRVTTTLFIKLFRLHPVI